MTKTITVKEVAGAYVLRKTFRGQKYSYTYGRVGSKKDRLYMEHLAAIADDECLNGTFSGFSKKVQPAMNPACRRWLIEKISQKDSLSKSDITVVNLLKAYKKEIRSRDDVAEFFDSINVGDASKRRYLTSVRKVAPDLCVGIAFKAGKGKPDPFSRSERKRILEWIKEWKPDYHLLFSLWFATGLRNGEMAGLYIQDIAQDGGMVEVRRSIGRDGVINQPKAGSYRKVKVRESDVSSMLSECFSETFNESRLFVDWNERRIVNHVWIPCLKRLGIRSRKLYAIRHTAISELVVTLKGDLARVSRESGNSPEIISKHYLGVIED